MAGRYGVADQQAPRRHRSRKSRRPRLLRLAGTITGATLIGFGVVALLDPADSAQSQDNVAGGQTLEGETLAELRDSDSVSRSADRGPGRLVALLPKDSGSDDEQSEDADASEATPAEEPDDERSDDERSDDDADGDPGASEPDPDQKPEATGSLPADSGDGKRIVFDITQQQVWLVEENDEIARTYMVSGSRYDQLPEGTYEVFSKSEEAVSWTYEETMRYMVRFHRGENSNIGFHDIPVYDDSGKEVQTLSELGTPLSDGCIRQDHEDAKALWDFAPVGTTVVVVRT
ncbi:L,D-transpeptidase [Phytoactinopolyspora alkaliphila]|uniref:L,D-transpeptidase n=1 Tax=Phytoactinopolyspora alkaliphila TaxID=1783498 RepID=A0A6N9YQ94_9ACTN|nr:L,D-transpeptidase [Phytoactinopolyspora alkaliphila]NED97183.1 L,D-transpeptidase [Phytoactinopolyspora alkaliphila]